MKKIEDIPTLFAKTRHIDNQSPSSATDKKSLDISRQSQTRSQRQNQVQVRSLAHLLKM